MSIQNAVYPLSSFGHINTNLVTTLWVSGSTTVSGADIRGTTSTIPNVSVTNLSGSGNVSGSIVLGSRQVINTINATIPSASMKIGELVLYTGANQGSTSVAAYAYLRLPSGSVGAIYVFSGSYVSAS